VRLLFGGRTYEDLLGYWNTQDSPFKDALNNPPKHVASTTLRDPLPWPNSTLLKGDLASAVAALKQQPGKELHVMGSGELIQALMAADLIDEYMLLIHPLVLGSGRRLFPDGGPPATLRPQEQHGDDHGRRDRDLRAEIEADRPEVTRP
jgi:dihydrofolate reductase